MRIRTYYYFHTYGSLRLAHHSCCLGQQRPGRQGRAVRHFKKKKKCNRNNRCCRASADRQLFAHWMLGASAAVHTSIIIIPFSCGWGFRSRCVEPNSAHRHPKKEHGLDRSIRRGTTGTTPTCCCWVAARVPHREVFLRIMQSSEREIGETD